MSHSAQWIVCGHRVKFRAGRGFSEGRVVNLDEGMATIETANGKHVRRVVTSLEPAPVEASTPPSPPPA